MSEVDGSQRRIGVLVLVLVVVLVPGLLTAGCYYSASTYSPPMSGEGTDAGGDSGPGSDAATCFGTAPFNVCLAEAPTQPLSIPQQPIDTSTDPRCVVKNLAGSQCCVLAGTTITVDATLRATGSRPLVLIASDTIMISGMVDVGSHRGATPETGAGADPDDCMSGQGVAPIHGGGGAGGSFVGLGGTGGTGSTSGERGGTPGHAYPSSKLHGGCPGQGAGFSEEVKGGHGGGAVLLIAVRSISVIGTVNAAGEGGGGGPLGTGDGGGGGGAGGMIVLDALSVTSSGRILASGGGGGGGSSDGTNRVSGGPGADPGDEFPAAGGPGGTADGQPHGGNGGKGSANAANAGGLNGDPGGVTMSVPGWGGGGGGGTGIVIAPAGATLGTHVSPDKTTTP